jgi:nucleoside-diphosphate-sugar epimerase
MPIAYITGGSGFVGRTSIPVLLERGYQVRALARSDAAIETVRRLGADPIHGDLDSSSTLVEAMRGCDVVFHLAAVVDETQGEAVLYHANVEGTSRVLEAAIAAGVPRLVHCSTEAVLIGGPPIVDADETWPRPKRHIGAYARTKALAEERVLAATSSSLATVIVRPRFVWGKGDTTILPQLVDSVRQGRFAWIDGGRYLTSTCHVRNAAEGLALAAERGQSGEIYFLTDGPPVEFRAFITALLRTRGVDPGDRSLPRWLASSLGAVAELAWSILPLKGAPPITRGVVQVIGRECTVSDAKARQALGYVPVVTMDAGLEALSSGA